MPFYAQGNDISRSSSNRDTVDPKTFVNKRADSLTPLPRLLGG